MKIAPIIVAALAAASDVNVVSAFTVIRPHAATAPAPVAGTATVSAAAAASKNIHCRRTTTISPLRALFFAEEKEGTEEISEKSEKSEKSKAELTSSSEKSTSSSNNDDDNEEEEEEIVSMVGSKKSDFQSMSGTIYDKIGFKEDQIAIGIDPEAVRCSYHCHCTLNLYLYLYLHGLYILSMKSIFEFI